MITGELRSKVDKIWEIFWTGGITNPIRTCKVDIDLSPLDIQ